MTGPLEGVRVVELAGIGPGPFAGMLLADLGADVVRVDRPDPGPLAQVPRYDLTNRGKRSVAVDLKHPGGPEAVLRLVERADVLLEGYRPGVAERLGVGPEACLGRNPRLVYGRMTGWGQDGPLARRAGHDITYLALSGALGTIGRAGGPPQVPVNLLGDFGGGSLYLVVGVLAALLEARTSGQGQVVDAAIVDGSAHLTTLLHGMMAAGGWNDERGTNLLDTGAPFYDVYETSDGGYLAVGPLEPQFFREFVTLLGVAGHAADAVDPSRWPALRQVFAAAFAQRTREEWTTVFDGTDACVAPVLSLREAPDHPHLRERQTYVVADGVPQPAPAPRFSRTPARLGSLPPEPGRDGRQVLADWDVPGADELLGGPVRDPAADRTDQTAQGKDRLG